MDQQRRLSSGGSQRLAVLCLLVLALLGVVTRLQRPVTTADVAPAATEQEPADATTAATVQEPTAPVEAATPENAQDPTYTYTTWDEEAAPEYYRIVDYAHIAVRPQVGTVTYAPLDRLGRAGQAVACVTWQMMEDGRSRERKDVSDLRPSGWGHNAEVDIKLWDGTAYHGYLWNRSHLIAKSLGGDEVLENLVCGTRMQNVGSNRAGGTSGGMAYCENLVRLWLDQNPDGWVTYVATPVYEGDELVCRSVIVDMRSSDGGLDVRAEVYNTAKGFAINYATGEFAAAR